MAIRIKTTNPNGLYQKVRSAVSVGKVKSWTLSTVNGIDYFLLNTPERQSLGTAWFKPGVSADQLIFSIVRPQGGNVSSHLYAVLHGALTEMMLANFDKEFSIIWATALPESSDTV